MRRFPILLIPGAISALLLCGGCANTEAAIPVHDKEAEGYEYSANELTKYSLNLLAVMVQERLNGAQDAHAARQAQLIAANDAAGAVKDEREYQAILDELQTQVLREFDKIAKMYQGIAAARAFHDVVQEGLRRANKLDVGAVIQLADAVTQAVGLDLGPLSDVIANIKKARGLPKVELPPVVPGT